MELRIKPFSSNIYPLGGFLIKNDSITEWIKELQSLGITLSQVELYPIPNTTLNSLWGCLVIPIFKVDTSLIGKNELCQKVGSRLFIPEKAILFPKFTLEEIDFLFPKALYIMHPEFGLAELSEPLLLEEYLHVPQLSARNIVSPEPSIFIPKEVKSFQIIPISEEDIIKKLNEDLFPKREILDDQPLSAFEKLKYLFYKFIFKTSKSENGPHQTDKKDYWQEIKSFIGSFIPQSKQWAQKLLEDYEDLEKRNQKEVDKLMDMLKNNPDEALKYAIPLDEMGSGRGADNQNMPFSLSKIWSDFSLLSYGNNNRSGGNIDLGNNFYELQAQYEATAQAFIRQQEYQKAAFIYMKLLKNFYLAAQTLEEGQMYQEAASIYLKNLNNKAKAAECYEKGSMINKAIELYKELSQNEKVGDLYIQLGKKKEADIYYEKVINSYVLSQQYLKASFIHKNKIGNWEACQDLLLQGWKSQKDSFNCLNNYFSNIEDSTMLKEAISNIYDKHVNPANSTLFLQVIKHEYTKNPFFKEELREMAYEIVAQQTANNPNIVSELKSFNEDNKMLLRDTIIFRNISR